MIAVECYADITLVQTLTSLPREDIAHYFRGKSGVCKQLQNGNQLKGMIDEDPLTAKHPYELDGIINNQYSEYDIKQRRYPNQCNELIILCPTLEDWVVKTAKFCDIDLKRHGLPDDPNALHRVIDQHLDDFRMVINMLKKRDCPRIEALAALLRPS